MRVIHFSVYMIFLILIGSCTRDIVVPVAINDCNEGQIYFEKDLLPVIVSSCATTGCHADSKPQEGIRLHDMAHILKSVVPGNPEKSDLYNSLAGVISVDDEDAMPPPPNVALTEQQIDDIYNWIKDGAILYECDTECMVETVQYSSEVTDVMNKYCIGCHSASSASGNVKLHDYANVKKYALSGSLMGSINHDNGYSFMPPSGSNVDPCDVRKLQKWIDEGALDN